MNYVKKALILSIAVLIASGNAVSVQASSTGAVKAGLTPEDSFYFLDAWSESVMDFFTFNPAKKADLQMKFAAERVAEIKDMLDKKGIEAPGLAVAEERLVSHFAKATEIMDKKVKKGDNVNDLSDRLSKSTEEMELNLEEIFDEKMEDISKKQEDLEIKISEALDAGDDAKAAEMEKEFDDLGDKLDLYAEKNAKLEGMVEDGEIVFYKTIDDTRKASKRMRQAESEKGKVKKTEDRRKISSPVEDISRADSLFDQAKAEFDKGNFGESSKLALLARTNFELLKANLDDSANRANKIARGKQSDLEKTDKRGAERRMKEAEREKGRAIREADRRKTNIPDNVRIKGDDLFNQAVIEFGRGNMREAERLAKGAKIIFIIIRANARDFGGIGEDFEVELERERLEVEIRNRFVPKIEQLADDIRLRSQTKVVAEIFGNGALGKVEVKFGSSLTDRNAIAQEIVNRMKLTRDQISRLLVVQQRRGQEELSDRLEAKSRVRRGASQNEAKLRFPVSFSGAVSPVPTPALTPTPASTLTPTPAFTPSPIPGGIISESQRQQIVDRIFQRAQALRADDILRAMEFRNDDAGVRIERGEIKVVAEILGNDVLAKVETKFGSPLTERNAIAEEITNRMKLTRDEISRLLVIQQRVEREELRDRLEAKSRVRRGASENEAKLRFPLNTTNREQIIDGIFARVQRLAADDILAAMEFRNDDSGARITPRPASSPSSSPMASPTGTPGGFDDRGGR